MPCSPGTCDRVLRTVHNYSILRLASAAVAQHDETSALNISQLLRSLFFTSQSTTKTSSWTSSATQSRTNEIVRTTINNLADASSYDHQAWALEACYGSRDITIAKQALASPSRYLKKRALNLIGLLGTDDEFLAALKSAPPYLQTHTSRRFRDARRHRQRLHVIEAFLEDLEQTNSDPSLFRSLLPLGSREILDRNLKGLIDHFSLIDWSHLAKYYPVVTQKFIQDWVDRSNEDDEQLGDTINHLLVQWLAHEYDFDYAVAIFKVGLKKISMSRLLDKTLVAKRPEKVFQIILDHDEEAQEHIIERMETKTLRQLPLPQFLKLFERYPDIIDSWNSPNSFDDLTFEQRKALYPIVKVGWRNQGGILDRISLEKLPTEDRIKEARRHMTSSKFVAKPEGKIKYIAMLPWDEAMELQTPFLRSSDADIRSEALKCQIAAAKFDDSHLSDALKMALARKNEQDPVKKEIVAGLVEIPASRWKGIHLNDLEAILRNLLDTSDTSTATLYSMTELVTRILSFHPPWASKQLRIIVNERGPHIRPFELAGVNAVDSVIAHVAQEFSPILMKLRNRKDISGIRDLQNIISAFSKYCKYWPELMDTCQKVLNDPKMENIHWSMIDVLKKNQPRTWTRIIPSLFQEKREKALTNGKVVDHIHLRQQNFLWNYLKAEGDISAARREALKANVGTSRYGFWRWTQSQQDTFAEILIEEIKNEDLESDKKLANVKQLSALAFVDAKHLIELANNNEHPIIQETALRSLGKLDAGQGVPVLVEALSDKRARIAIYALRTVLEAMAKADVFSLLKSVSLTRVTVAKETLRLIGDLKTDEAFKYLLERGNDNLHADVRLALFKGLLSYTDRDETWTFFQRTAEDPEPDIAKIVATVPEDGLSTHSKELLLKLLFQLLAHPDPVVRVHALKRCGVHPLHDPDNLLAPRLFELVLSTIEDEAEAASVAIFKTYATSNVELIGDTYRKLLKHRKTLQVFHGEYWFVALGRKKNFNPVTHMILKVLKEDRFSVKMRVKLMFEALYWDEIRPYLFEIVPELHADALVEMEGAIEDNMSRWKRSKDSLLDAELEMVKSEDERARRLALSLLIGGVDEDKGWTRAERDRLEKYRKDPSPLVAEKAWEFEIDEEGNELDGEKEE
ncbi:uncharacterized protein PAC_11525 [Phialocephala subalpina]|uniref:Uncharacterized protein n=1 Tax=Phialocephala subalpina TaxID=576137 RepID=A0A1L7X9B0_9HELO|nr:uncharacterized protein PAC_11525 [Phialocephala subalpina]